MRDAAVRGAAGTGAAGTDPRAQRVADLRFPRLSADAVVLERGADEWQVGLEPGRAVVFHGNGFRAVLRLLDGSHPLPMIRDVAKQVGMTRPQLNAALAALVVVGLLHERDVLPASAAPSARVRLIGAGQVGRQVATLLVESGLGELYVFDDEPPEPLLASSALGSRGQALCSHLLRRGPGTVAAVRHWSKPEAPAMDLTVVAVDRPEVDRLLTEHLVRTDQPHLLVRCHGSSVVVGPLVLPGRTSCVRCADLARRDADPHWPTVLNQLTRVSQTASPALVAWAAAVTVVQALSFLAGGTPETAGATLEIGSSDHAMRLRSWPAHAECGCGWWPTAEWGA